MGAVPALGAGKGVALTHTHTPAPAAFLTGMLRGHLSHQHACLLCLSFGPLADALSLPEGPAAARRFAAHRALPGLWDAQGLEDEHGLSWREGHELLRGGLGEGAGAIATLVTKPFEHAADTARVRVLCLAGRLLLLLLLLLLLHTLARLVSSFVGDLDGFPADEEGLAVRIHRDQGVRLVEVYSHRMYALWVWGFQRQGDSAKQAPIALDDAQAVNLLGRCQCRLEGVRYRAGEAFTPRHSPDRERAVRAEVCVTATLPGQEQCTGATEGEGAIDVMPIACGTGIGTCREADRRAGHLAVQRASHLAIHRVVQRYRAEGLAAVLGRFRERGLDAF